MHFHLCLANHDVIGQQTLYDMICWIRAGLLELGHTVTASDNTIHPDAINIFWEKFFPDMGNKIQNTGIVYGIIATEIPDGNGFNWRSDSEWQSRYNGFKEAAYGASFIWTMVEQTVDFYAEFAPAAYLELGFSKYLIPEVNVPDIDFSFYGLKTPYRVAVIEKLKKYANVVWPDNFLTNEQVASLVARTRIGLNFKQSSKWPIPSPTRLGRFLMAKRGIISENIPTITRQAELISIAPETSDFIDYAMQQLKGDWKEKAENAFEQYRLKMPMSEIVDNVLRQTTSSLALRTKKILKSRAITIRLNPVQLIKNITILNICWNILSYNGKYYAVNQSLGQIDFTVGDIILREQFSNAIFIASSYKFMLLKLRLFSIKNLVIKIVGRMRSCSKRSLSGKA